MSEPRIRILTPEDDGAGFLVCMMNVYGQPEPLIAEVMTLTEARAYRDNLNENTSGGYIIARLTPCE